MEENLVAVCWDLINHIQRVNGTPEDSYAVMEKMGLITKVVHQFNAVVKLTGTEIPDVHRLLEHILIECTKLVLSENYQDTSDSDTLKESFIASIRQIANDTRGIPQIYRKFSQMSQFVTSKNVDAHSNVRSADNSPEKSCPNTPQRGQNNMESTPEDYVINLEDEDEPEIKKESENQADGPKRRGKDGPVPVMCFKHVSLPGGTTLVPIIPECPSEGGESTDTSPDPVPSSLQTTDFQQGLLQTTATQSLLHTHTAGPGMTLPGYGPVHYDPQDQTHMPSILLSPESLTGSVSTHHPPDLGFPDTDMSASLNWVSPEFRSMFETARTQSTLFSALQLPSLTSGPPPITSETQSDLHLVPFIQDSEPSSHKKSKRARGASDSPQSSKKVVVTKSSKKVSTSSKGTKSQKNSPKLDEITKPSSKDTKKQKGKRSVLPKTQKSVSTRRAEMDKPEGPSSKRKKSDSERKQSKDTQVSRKTKDSNLSKDHNFTNVSKKVPKSPFLGTRSNRKKQMEMKMIDTTKIPVVVMIDLLKMKPLKDNLKSGDSLKEKTSKEKSQTKTSQTKTLPRNQKKTAPKTTQDSEQIVRSLRGQRSGSKVVSKWSSDKESTKQKTKVAKSSDKDVAKKNANGSGNSDKEVSNKETINSGNSNKEKIPTKKTDSVGNSEKERSSKTTKRGQSKITGSQIAETSKTKPKRRKESTSSSEDEEPEKSKTPESQNKEENFNFRLSKEERSHCLEIANILEEVGLETPVISCTLCDAKFFSKSGHIGHMTYKHAGEAWNPYTRRNTIDLRPRRTTSFDTHSAAQSSITSAGSGGNDSGISGSPATVPVVKEEPGKCDSSDGASSDSDDLICTSVQLVTKQHTSVSNSPVTVPSSVGQRTDGDDSEDDMICLGEDISDSDDDIVCTGVDAAALTLSPAKKNALKQRLRKAITLK